MVLNVLPAPTQRPSQINSSFHEPYLQRERAYFFSGLTRGQGKYQLHEEGRERKEACKFSFSLITRPDMSCVDVVFRDPVRKPFCRCMVLKGYSMLFVFLLVLSDLERWYLQPLWPHYTSYSHLYKQPLSDNASVLLFPACSMDIIARPEGRISARLLTFDPSYSFSQRWIRKRERKERWCWCR